jgi:hypothetical protein
VDNYSNHTFATLDALRASRKHVSDWLWRPWYAKLWWAAIPAWWAGMAVSTKVTLLTAFYDSALAGFLNVLFSPLTALMVLGVGYVRHLLARPSVAGVRGSLSDDASSNIADFWEEHDRAFEDLNASTDIHDPRSGALYIGNPISPNNGARINVF